MHIGYWWESQKERSHSEDQGVGGWAMLKWILEKTRSAKRSRYGQMTGEEKAYFVKKETEAERRSSVNVR
jgi:hypothetical protein